MSAILNKAASVAGPLAAADTTGNTGVVAYATSSTSASAELPTLSAANGPVDKASALEGRYVTIKSLTADVRVNFSRGAAQTLVYAQASTWASPSAARGWTIQADTEISVIVPRGATHLNYITASAAGEIEIYCSEAGVVS